MIKVSILILSILTAGCDNNSSVSRDSYQNIENKAEITSAKKQGKPMIKIIQGTVGKVGDFSVGVSGISDGSAKLSVWNRALPQSERNDYLISYKTKAGEIVPIGSGYYTIGAINKDQTDLRNASVEIESEQTKVDGSLLSADSLAVPVSGILELHGNCVELISVKSENGKSVAEVEIYSNNYPKENLKEKGEITKVKLSEGDEIKIGAGNHKITAVTSGSGNVRGVLQISVETIK